MTNPQALIDLAAKCEAADGPDRGELDYHIWIAVNAPEAKLEGNGSDRPYRVRLGGSPLGGGKLITPCERPRYTASLDAAMSLVPEGWRLAVLEEDWRSGLYRAQLSPRPTAQLIEAFERGETISYQTADSNEQGRCTVAAPALAVCAASLRAKASS